MVLWQFYPKLLDDEFSNWSGLSFEFHGDRQSLALQVNSVRMVFKDFVH